MVFETYWCNDKLSITVDFDNRMIPRHTFISNLKHNICKKLKTKSTVNTRFCCCKVYKYLSNIAHITINNALYQSTFYLLTYLLTQYYQSKKSQRSDLHMINLLMWEIWPQIFRLIIILQPFCHKRSLCCHAVSVCPCVTFLDSVETNKDIFIFFTIG